MDIGVVAAIAVWLDGKGGILLFYFFRVIAVYFTKEYSYDAVVPAVIGYVIYKGGIFWLSKVV
jgi:hypothetical protein